jgi:hypothetical protein
MKTESVDSNGSRERYKKEVPSPLAAQAELVDHLFAGAKRRVVLERRDGSMVTIPNARWKQPTLTYKMRLWYLTKHLAGQDRVGYHFGLPGGRCRVAALDLDAHASDSQDRFSEALYTVEFLGQKGITAYAQRSRGGKGAHVWVLLERPILTSKATTFLMTLAQFLRRSGPVEVFPNGRALMLPYHGGIVDMLDSYCRPVSPDKLEQNDPRAIEDLLVDRSLIRRPSAGRAHPDVQAALDVGLVWIGEDGRYQARRGARNLVAGRVATAIALHGGSFQDFAAWDQRNMPPLASDEPESLRHWWKRALRVSKLG